MNIFGLTIITKKKYNALLTDNENKKDTIEKLVNEIDTMSKEISTWNSTYPFRIGQTVYDLQLRNEKGKFTKNNPSIEHSEINPVVVTTNNYFKLLARYEKKDVFQTQDEAYNYLVGVCDKK